MINRLVNTGFPALLLLLMVAVNFMPRLVVPFMLLLGLLSLAAGGYVCFTRKILWRDVLKQPIFWLAGFMLVQLALVDTFSETSKTLAVISQLLLTGSIFLFLPRLLGELSSAWLRWFTLALIAGYAFTLMEGMFDFPVYRFLSGAEGVVALHQLKWVETILLMFSFPVVYGLVREKSWGYVALIAVLLLAVLSVSITQSVHMGLAAGLLFFPIGWFFGQKLYRIAVVALVLLAVAMPFTVQYLFQNHADAINEMPFVGFRQGNGAHRLEIYDAVAAKIAERPWLGYGVDASRHVNDFPIEKRFYHTTHVYHPHNCLLQFWFDLGVFGMCIALAVMVWVLRAVSRVQNPLQRAFSLAATAAGFSIALVGYGVWQSWWLATLALTAVLFMLVARMPCRYLSSSSEEAGVEAAI